jgi:malonate-semialdehyde dehydrogenase (acetylating)/methylmalonate-semialdehyde dehydrogenase
VAVDLSSLREGQKVVDRDGTTYEVVKVTRAMVLVKGQGIPPIGNTPPGCRWFYPSSLSIESKPVRPIHHWVGGRPLAGASGRSGAVYDPATGRQTGAVDFASAEEVDAAVQAAKAAFPAWRALSLAKRAELFFAIRELFDAHREDLARLLTAEHGKVLSDALGEVARGLEVIEYCCGIPTLLKGGYSEQASTGIDVYAIRQPLGVVAGITPFNFPAMVPMWMWAPALACGNTFVLKPSEKDPSASVRTAELLQEAGVPDGVFNVVHGDKVAVDALLEHRDVAAVSFVGSTPTARYVYEKATAAGKRCQALGGAKNHMVVLPDADLDMAADAAVSAAYGSAGERCMAVSVVVAVGGVADELVAKISERIPKVKVAAGTEPGAEMGPLVTREHRDRVASYVENAPAEGATVVVDGREAVPEGEGFFLGPTLIDHVRPEMASYRDEIFGPVLGVTRVDTYDEAVRLVNENPYGNGTAIFTRDGGVARRFQFDVQAGMVGINVPIPVPVAYYSFGGWKSSLFGDRHIYGPEGIDFYTRTKVVTARWPDPATSRVDLGFPQTR